VFYTKCQEPLYYSIGEYQGSTGKKKMMKPTLRWCLRICVYKRPVACEGRCAMTGACHPELSRDAYLLFIHLCICTFIYAELPSSGQFVYLIRYVHHRLRRISRQLDWPRRPSITIVTAGIRGYLFRFSEKLHNIRNVQDVNTFHTVIIA